jgi:hypothetical protein
MNVASPSERKVALVTGASGFTGRYVVAGLAAAGYAVYRRSYTHHADESERYCVDLVDREQVRAAVSHLSPDVVVHLAAITFVAHGDADAIYRLNISGTPNLLEALAMQQRQQQRQRPTRMLLASSADVYGNVGGLISEQSPVSPQNHYAVSKLTMEDAVVGTVLPHHRDQAVQLYRCRSVHEVPDPEDRFAFPAGKIADRAGESRCIQGFLRRAPRRRCHRTPARCRRCARGLQCLLGQGICVARGDRNHGAHLWSPHAGAGQSGLYSQQRGHVAARRPPQAGSADRCAPGVFVAILAAVDVRDPLD